MNTFAAGSAARLASPGRKNSQPFAAANAVGLEIVVVDREDRRKRLALGEMHERRIRDIHWPIAILPHESIEVGEIGVRDGKDRDGARANEGPRGLHVARVVAQQMKELCQNRAGCRERKPEVAEGIAASRVPWIVTVEARQEGARVGQRPNVHGHHAAASVGP